MSSRRRVLLSIGMPLAGWLALRCPPAQAHATRLADLWIDHPYALPSNPGANQASAHIRSLRNDGALPERLLGARTAVAGRVELRRRGTVARVVDAIALPPGDQANLRHDGDYELVLVDLNRPLRTGERFTLTLIFERAGECEVTVWVQAPRARVPHRA